MRRVLLLPRRYGFTSNQFVRDLGNMVSLLKKHNVVGTFPTTAKVLARHAFIIRALEGMEVAVHGLCHIDSSALPSDDQKTSIESAVALFKENGLEPVGFRAPYLRWSQSLLNAVAAVGFLYDSSIPAGWSCGARFDSMPKIGEALSSYEISEIGSHIPSIRGRLVEFPVAMPDDEILIDRLGIESDELLSEALTAMVDSAAETQGHLVLQLHPERFHFFRTGLDEALDRAKERGAWIAPLREVARWWTIRPTREQRWPNGSSFALTVSGDIDAVTLGDFLGRRLGR